MSIFTPFSLYSKVVIAVECPSEIIDQLGGWSLRSIGQGYGNGYELSVLSRWMKKI